MINRDKTQRRRFYNVPTGTRWINVIWCPKDASEDDMPAFSKGSKFPLNQFVESLRTGVWPEGMIVRLVLLAHRQSGERVEKKIRYIVPRKDKQYGLMLMIEDDHRKFLEKVAND